MVVVTVILNPDQSRREEVVRLLAAFRDSLATDPPDGMQGLVVLQAESGEFLVEGHWRDADAHRRYRSNQRGADLFRKLADCCGTPPVTYYGTPDPSLSFDPDRSRVGG